MVVAEQSASRSLDKVDRSAPPTELNELTLNSEEPGLPVWFSPCGPRARAALDERFGSLTEGVSTAPFTIDLKGRQLTVPRAAGGVARMGFEALCVEARGAADYLALAAHFHTLVLDNIPLLEPQKKNEAVRFVTLIDALYEAKVKLLASADGAPQALYPAGDEAFEFERTVSRLMEMQSRDYLALPHIGGETTGS